MYKSPSRARSMMRRFANRWLDRLENNGNPDMSSNGEARFLRELASRFPRDRQPVVFDVGGNMGDYTELLLAASGSRSTPPKVHVFEPSSACLRKLSERFGGQDNIVIVPAALSDTEGEASIHFDRQGSGLASLHVRNLDFYGISASGNETISTLRADRYIRENGIEHVHFAKIDVEGHEVSVLRGFGDFLDPGFIDYIQFEYGGASLDSRTSLMELFQVLTQAGFELAKIMPSTLEPRTYHPNMETFRYANFVASGKGTG
jgi:FkbM family methyltransferase